MRMCIIKLHLMFKYIEQIAIHIRHTFHVEDARDNDWRLLFSSIVMLSHGVY